MKKLLLFCLLFIGVIISKAQNPTYINTSFSIFKGVPTTWYGDVTFGPDAVVYLEDGATGIFYGKNMVVDPLAKFICFSGGVQTGQTGTGVIIFRENNPLYPGYPTQQNLNGGYSTGIDPSIPNIEIDNKDGVSFNGNTRITNNVFFTKGHIFLNNFNLVMDDDAMFITADVKKHVVTNGTGVVVKENVLAGKDFVYPISIAGEDFTPTKITNLAGTRNINVQVKNYANSAANEDTFATKGMDRTWQVSSNVAGAATVSLQHNTVNNTNGNSTDASAFNNAMAYVSQQVTSGFWSMGTTTNGGTPVSTHVGNNLILPATVDATAYFTKKSNAIVAMVDLSINKTTTAIGVSIGQEFDYTLEVKNIGTNPATQVVATDVLPVGLTYVSSSTANGSANYTNGTNTVSWNIGNLAVGGVATLTIKVKAQNAGVISNTATVTSLEVDSNLPNNTSTILKDILNFKIPNVITPDGDGKNDSFKIIGLDAYPNNNMVIYNRWGNEVWHSTGASYKNDWTGQGLNEGTYYYVLQLKDKTGTMQVFKGWVTLLKD